MGLCSMNEFIQSAILLFGVLTVVKLLISDFFGILKLLISELNDILIKIKDLEKNIKKKKNF